MNWLANVLRKLRLLGRREQFKRELEEEMTFHRELTEKELVADGMPATQAHFAARRQFGNDARLRHPNVINGLRQAEVGDLHTFNAVFQ